MKNQKTMMNMAGGLVVGLILGLILGIVGADSGLFGTASNTSGNTDANLELVPSRFYRVDLESAQQWLQSVNPDTQDDLADDLTVIQQLQQALSLGQQPSEEAVNASDQAIETVLLRMRDLLLEDEDNQNIIEAFNTCIGFNNDPYTGPGVYLYLEVPEEGEDNVPSDWEAQGSAQDGILWSTECLNE